MKQYSIFLAGVGGQGILTAGSIISTAALIEGKNVLLSEIHGMSQRLGSVYMTVRIGEVTSPLIPKGEADMMIALELIEATRYAHMLKSEGWLILNENLIPPPGAMIGSEKVPSETEIIKSLETNFKRIIKVNALKIAEELGSYLLQNTILLGIAFAVPEFPLRPQSGEEAIKRVFAKKQKIIELNIRAFRTGLEFGKKLIQKIC